MVSDAQLATLKAKVSDSGVHYQQVRAISKRAGIFGWAVTPKVHKVQHLPLVAESINTRYCQCYAEDATMGTVSTTWKGSARGRYTDSVQEVVLLKRLLALVLRLELGL